MGNLSAKPADQQHLLDDTDDVTLMDEISVVVMGHRGVGKNTVANAILMKKAFTFLDRSKANYLKDENTTFRRHITVTRVPGWSADLNSEKNFQLWRVIKDSVCSVKKGPHVIIWVVDMNTRPAETTQEKLKQLLGENVLQHILIVSVDSKNVVVYKGGKKLTIDRCKHYFFIACTCEKQNITFIETIEEFIVCKRDTRFYGMQKKPPNLELQHQEQTELVDRLKLKISALSASLNSKRNVINSQTAEINELRRLLKEKEDMLISQKQEIERLKSNQNHTELSVLHKRIEQLENEAKSAERFQQKMEEEHQRKIGEMKKNLKEKDREIEILKKENQELKSQKERKTKAKRSYMRRPKKKGTNSFELESLISEETMDGEAHQDSEVDRVVQFLKENRKELIEKIVAVIPIADDLHESIKSYKYEMILKAPTVYDQRRQLYDITDKGGTKLQVEFYKSLLKHEKFLVEDLEMKHAKTGSPQEWKASVPKKSLHFLGKHTHEDH